MITSTHWGGGRRLARRLAAAGVLLAVLGAGGAAHRGTEAPSFVTVREDGGVYEVSARFAVPEAPSIVLAVLTDYEAIPRILPEVKTSVVREGHRGRTVVEQEVVARMLFFTRRLHLLLEVQEDSDAVSFRDACGCSFALYHGAWRIWIEDGLTQISYELSAQPAFDVPTFVLTRLLDRDAKRMIARLSAEMTSRVLKTPPPQSTRTRQSSSRVSEARRTPPAEIFTSPFGAQPRSRQPASTSAFAKASRSRAGRGQARSCAAAAPRGIRTTGPQSS